MFRTVVFAHARCNRAVYWVTMVVLMVAHLVVIPVVLEQVEPHLWPVAVAAWLAASTYVWLVVFAARIRAAGDSGWKALWTFVPLFGMVFIVWYGFKNTPINSDAGQP